MTKRTQGRDGAAAASTGRVGAASARETVMDDAAAEKSAAETALRELWQDYKKKADPALRERLILHYSPLVKYVAGRMARRSGVLHGVGVFVLSIVVICFAVAWLTASAGLSIGLGAFLAGLILAESEYGHQTMAEVLPFRDHDMQEWSAIASTD